MPTQTVTITPPRDMEAQAVMDHIGDLMPSEVALWLTTAGDSGARNTSITKNMVTGEVTFTTEWTDEAAAHYKSLMAGVSDGVVAQAADHGYTLVFSPETADL
jgi:hypothetical protein